MSPEDFYALLRLFAVACGGVVLIFAVAGHRREQRRAARREQREREWNEIRDRLRKRRDRVTYHRGTENWKHNHGPQDAA